jgi:raffinose/stachyose/melibiose transport system permease protein
MTNSLIYVVFTVIGVLLLGGMAAYSLARLDPPGGGLYMVYMLTLSAIPFWLYVIPLFILWRNLGLLNSRIGLIIMYIAINSPFAIFLLRSFFTSLPRDFEDAARVDGANEWQVMARIVVPMMWPAFLTVGLVVALGVWGEFQAALIFLQDDTLLPVTTSYYNFTQRFGRDWSLTSAGAVMMILPVLIVFLALQRRFVEGLTQGGMKM